MKTPLPALLACLSWLVLPAVAELTEPSLPDESAQTIPVDDLSAWLFTEAEPLGDESSAPPAPLAEPAPADLLPVLPPDAPAWAFALLEERRRSPRRPVAPPLTSGVAGASSLQATSEEGAFRITAIYRLPDQTVLLEWTSQPGRRYRIDSSTDLETWFVAKAEVFSGGTTSLGLDEGISYEWPKTPPPLAGNPPRKFWRVVDIGAFDQTGLGLVVGTTDAVPLRGDASVTVTAIEGAADMLDITLYVDGRTVGKARELPATFVFNTSEFPNGVHRIHAVATAVSPVVTGSGLPTVRRAVVSAPLTVSSENFVSAWSFSQGPFYPQLGEVQRTTAKFEAATDWRLYMFNRSGYIVREASGTGSSLDYTWDGRDEGGATVPFDAYYFFLDLPPFLTFSSAKAGASVAGDSSAVGQRLPGAYNRHRLGQTALRVGGPASSALSATVTDAPAVTTTESDEPTIAPTLHNRYWVGWFAFSQAYYLDDYDGSGLENFDGAMKAEAEGFNDMLRQAGWFTATTLDDERFSLPYTVGPTYGGLGPLRNVSLGLIGGHGEYRPSGFRFNLPAPFGMLKHWNKAEGTMTDVPIPAMELGDDAAPTALRWAVLLLCDVLHPSAVANGLGRNNLIGPRMRGLVGAATKFAIGGSAVAREWAFQMHVNTGGIPDRSLAESWYRAGQITQQKTKVADYLRDRGISVVTFRVVYRNNCRNDNALTMFSSGSPGEFIEADDPVNVWTD
jgi:hypothetical protein